MKKVFLMAMAIAAVVITSCSNDYGETPQPTPTPPPSKEDPTPQPNPQDSTDVDSLQWVNVLKKYLGVDDDRKVTSTMIAGRKNGSLDSTKLVYTLGFELAAPDTVRITTVGSEMTTFGGSLSYPGAEYSPTKWENCDSAIVATTTKGYKTNHYNVIWKTSHVNGWRMVSGLPEPFKNDIETTSYKSLSLYKDAYEVERNDSIYLREEVKNVVNMTFHGKTFTFEKKVVVDHFIKMKEKEEEEEKPTPEPEHNHPSWWGEPVKIIGQGTFIYKPGVGANGQGQFFKNINVLFENVLVCVTTKSYVKEDYSPIDFDWDNAVVYTIGSTLRGKKITSKNVTDLNSVIWRDGKWEAALCQYDQKNFSWTYMSPDAFDTVVTEHLAETCGLKNFAGKHTARLHPSLFYSASLSNGTLTIKDDNGATIKSFH